VTATVMAGGIDIDTVVTVTAARPGTVMAGGTNVVVRVIGRALIVTVVALVTGAGEIVAVVVVVETDIETEVEVEREVAVEVETEIDVIVRVDTS
jgi:hypothetical protein